MVKAIQVTALSIVLALFVVTGFGYAQSVTDTQSVVKTHEPVIEETEIDDSDDGTFWD